METDKTHSQQTHDIAEPEESSSRLSRLPRTARSIGSTVLPLCAGLSYLFSQSPLNETIRVHEGFKMLMHTGNPVAVGAVVAGITVAIEAIPSIFVALSLNKDEGRTGRFNRAVRGRYELKEEEAKVRRVERQGSPFGRMINQAASASEPIINSMTALGVGASVVTARKHVRDEGTPSLLKDLKNSAKSTALIASVAGATGYLVTGGINNVQDTVLEKPAELFVDYMGDNKFIFGLVIGGYAALGLAKTFSWAKNRLTNPQESRNLKQVWKDSILGQTFTKQAVA